MNSVKIRQQFNHNLKIMPNKTKYKGGPKSTETKAISSRNPITHGLTAQCWLNTNEQSLFDELTKGLIDYFDPLNYIEKLFVTKMAECLVRLEHIRQTELVDY